MTNQTPENQLNQLEQTVTYLGRNQAQTDEILLLLARRSAEHDSDLQAVRREHEQDLQAVRQEHEQAMQTIRDTLDRTAQQQAANAVQIAANTEGIAALRAILRKRYNGNGQTPE